MNLYHYCSNAAFLSIISTRSIWVSEFSLSNDLLEGRWIRKVFSDCCDERKVSAVEKDGLLRLLDSIISYLGAAGFCMSEEPDLLSQWRADSDNACGVSVGFNSHYLESLSTLKLNREDDFNASLRRVEYEIDRQKSQMEKELEHIFSLTGKGAFDMLTLLTSTPEKEEQRNHARRDLVTAIFTLFPFLYAFKTPAFAEEREWRLISLVTPSETTDGFALNRMDFRSLTDRIVPYRSVDLEDLDTKAILEVVLGPRNITPERVVEAALLRNGWGKIPVRRSSASYR
jgi:Protein of unknown function (DUF2971)